MMEGNDRPESIGFSKSRFEALTDGIFAIAMTLLVLGLAVPAAGTIRTSTGLIEALMGLFPDFVHYVIAFFILHGMWVSHHVLSRRMAFIDRRFLEINLWLLMAICLIPFTTSFSGDFEDISLAAVVLEANLLVVGILLLLQWQYVARTPHLLSPEFTPSGLAVGMQKTAVTPAVSVLGIALALLGVTWSTAVYLLIPVIFWAMKTPRLRREAK
ncbi:MAG: TMEM175 family protein [Methanofollis liminatans]|uniref:DUF1211 domain-containing protein n=1 Tax=Methanofollis liminatans DSM 4140 TaxID=28892 RepID=J1AN56_9EURY|nr:TMEM175 family protein [Methanofollis liminatans]EJG06278.1 protein of unknown function DUF1211 [Methanofollis liminatans DSM 4140]MDD3111864.1 TMEM175 family protein [Methanofollis liminatans]